MHGETPTITNYVYTTSAVVPMSITAPSENAFRRINMDRLRPTMSAETDAMLEALTSDLQKNQKGVKVMALRIVQVFIADIDENVPMDKRIIYQGPVHTTDATNEELFYGVNIGELLKTHNEMRTKIVNKTIKDRTEYLEPTRIRDLKMVVSTIAQF